MYRIKDLMNAIQPGYYYKEMLTKTVPPKPDESFKVEKILKTKIINKRKYIFVKYQEKALHNSCRKIYKSNYRKLIQTCNCRSFKPFGSFLYLSALSKVFIKFLRPL